MGSRIIRDHEPENPRSRMFPLMTTPSSSAESARPASPSRTREDLLAKSGAGYIRVRHSLCQRRRPEGGSEPGILGAIVTGRKRRALQLYLLLLTPWPWLSKQDQPLAASVWARALTTDKGRRWTTTNVSEAWRDLEELGLVARRRLARAVVVTPQREDGRGEYVAPAGVKGDVDDAYFTLPREFWTEEWFERLSLPALAMLLIVASRTTQKDEAWLTHKDAAQWYGLAPRSVGTALRELMDVGLLTERIEPLTTGLSATGLTYRHHYSLAGPFSTASRRAMQSAAKAQRKARVKTSAQSQNKKTPKKRTKPSTATSTAPA